MVSVSVLLWMSLQEVYNHGRWQRGRVSISHGEKTQEREKVPGSFKQPDLT